jgi:hypothetical protein
MNKSLKKEIGLIASLAFFAIALIAIGQVSGHEWKNDLNEDEQIICVNAAVVERTGLICHIYTDATNRTDLFNIEDSFNMDIVD